jgi:hypothetical protein
VVVVVTAEVVSVIHVAVAIARRLRKEAPLATLAATTLASVAVPVPATPAPIAAPAPLAAIVLAAVAAAEAVAVAPLAEAHALEAVVVALADKRYVNPYLNPL